MRSVKVQRTKIIARIDEHIQAILDRHANTLANYEKKSAEYDTALAKYRSDLAAWYERAAKALTGASKDKVKVHEDTGAYSGHGSVTLMSSSGKPVLRPTMPGKPVRPHVKVEESYPDGRVLQDLRAQKALLEASDDDVVTVGASDYGTLFTQEPGSLRW